ncbi:MAG TPA: glycoside hydrolase [Clostridiaceae bacterium]|nr:glycoside hydrolase [Clostridiaceae bacterium]
MNGGQNLRKRTRKFPVFYTFVILLALASSSVYYFFYKPNNNVVPAFSEAGPHLVVEGELAASGDKIRIVEEEILLAFETIKEYIDPYIHWDEKLGKVTVTTKDRVIRMKTESLDAMVNNEPMTLDIPVEEENGTVYVPIEFLSDFYNIEIQRPENNNVVIIDFKHSIKQLAEPIDENAVVRNGRSIRNPIIKRIDINSEEDNTMRVFEEYEKWYKVRLSDGVIGYIEKKFVVVKHMTVGQLPERDSDSPTWTPIKGKINLVWDQIWTKTDMSKVEAIDGLDVISPTWFQLSNKEGDLINRADIRYVEWAHNNGYKVWALLSNSFNDMEATREFLNNTDSRDNLIRKILAYSALYKLDGINIDIENLTAQDKDALTQFVREITPLLREQGLTVSIDINSSACYDREELAKVVDYVIVMTYDQHWKGSPKAGSVAQVSWVEKMVQKYLETIPNEKMVLGMPLYTRLWKEETGEDGGISLSSEALSMEQAKDFIEKNVANVQWDEESGQFYVEAMDENVVYKMWLEDKNSINLRLGLVHKYKLAGAASWSKNFGIQEVWEVINTNLKFVESYQQWKEGIADKKYVYNN